MNVFLLAACAVQAALMHADCHCNKMLLEAVQILYGALAHWRIDAGKDAYTCPNKHHPVVLWTTAGIAHFRWVLALALALCERYMRFKGEKHSCENHVVSIGLLLDFNLPEIRAKVPQAPHEDEFVDIVERLIGHSGAVDAARRVPRCTVGLPLGCNFAVFCPGLPSHIATLPWAADIERFYFRGSDHTVNAIESYRALIAVKFVVGLGVHVTWHGKSLPPPDICVYVPGACQILPLGYERPASKRKRAADERKQQLQQQKHERMQQRVLERDAKRDAKRARKSAAV